MEYRVTRPDGSVKVKRSSRVFTHAVISIPDGSYMVEFCGSFELATKLAASRTAAIVVPVEVA